MTAASESLHRLKVDRQLMALLVAGAIPLLPPCPIELIQLTLRVQFGTCPSPCTLQCNAIMCQYAWIDVVLGTITVLAHVTSSCNVVIDAAEPYYRSRSDSAARMTTHHPNSLTLTHPLTPHTRRRCHAAHAWRLPTPESCVQSQ